MGQKFTSEDIFRIAENNLSAVEEQEFRFLFATGGFREILSFEFQDDIDLDQDERNLLERILTKIRFFARGGR